ncbi:MAG: hypothetical protein O3C27_10705 [Actinomycetota bacterium]|nr:hypothetical protein [Actinomycetota bacterium]
MLLQRLLLAAVLLLGTCADGSDAAADVTGASDRTDPDGSTAASVLGLTATATSDGTGGPGPGDSSGDDPARDDDPAVGRSSSAPAPSAGPTSPPTVALSSPTTGQRSPAAAPAVGDDCRTPAIPPGQRPEAMSADLDGDGSEDQVFTVQHDEYWAMVATFGVGGGALIELVGVDPRSFVRLVGAIDIMGSGVDDLVVVTGVGAYTQQVGFVRLRDCDLLELAFEDSSPARFLSGASVSNGEALTCPGDGTLERIHFTAIPGSDDDGDLEFEGGFEPFRIEGNVVKRLSPDGGSDIPAEGVVLTIDDVSAISLFDCFGLEL